MKKIRNHERGSALLMSVLALALMTAAGLGLMYMANTENRINANYRTSQEAYFAAVAGIQEARDRLMPDAANAIIAPNEMPGKKDAVVYLLNPAVVGGAVETIDPANPANAYFDDQLCHQNYAGLNLTNPGGDVPCISAPNKADWYKYIDSADPFTKTTAAMRYKWVRISLKANNSEAPYYVDGGADSSTHDSPVCWNGVSEVVMPAEFTTCEMGPSGASGFTPVYVITAYAKGSRRMTQAQVALEPPFLTNAAIDSQDHVVLNGQLTVNGYDYCSCECTTTKQNGKTTISCSDRAGMSCDRGKYAIFSSSTVDNPTSSENLFAGTGMPEGSQPIAQNQSWPYDVVSLIQHYKNLPDAVDVRRPPYNYSCSGSPATCGTRAGQKFGVPPYFPPSPPANPAGPGNMASQITYVPGDLQLTGGSVGNGILMVDGNLDIHGGLQFNGLIVVRGVVSFTGGGSDSVNIYGAVLAGQQSLVDTIIGGGANVNYDHCALSQAAGKRPPIVISARELN